MKKKLVFDYKKCTGCRACELACSFSCEGVFSPTKSRINIVRVDEEGIDIITGCDHCDAALCALICPVGAIYRDEETDAVIIDEARCVGCRLCMMICPFAGIKYDPGRRIVYKCDLCHGNPECVKWCFTGAIRYEDVKNTIRNKRFDVARNYTVIETERLAMLARAKTRTS